MIDCIFCKIISGEIPSQKIYEDDYVYAFNDINPTAPVHFLLIPKVHIDSVNELDDTNIHYVSKVFMAIAEITKKLGIADDGYRVVNNCNDDGGQTVHHIHFHIIGGKALGWPPYVERT